MIWWRNAKSFLPHSLSDLTQAVIILFSSVYLTTYIFGNSRGVESLENGIVDFLSLLVVLIIYIIFHIFIISPYRAVIEFKKLGFWDGETYHYNKEKLVYTGVIHPVDEGIVALTFPPECKDTLVNTKTVISGAAGRVKAGFTCLKNNDRWVLHMDRSGLESKCGIRLDGKKQRLIVQSLPETIPVQVRVYIDSWTI